MKRRIVLALVLAALATTPMTAHANNQSEAQTPNSPAQPSALGVAAVTGKDLVAGAGGSYRPIPPATLKPGGQDPATQSASAAPPYPAPGCPPGFSYLQPSPHPTFYQLFPTFTRNATGAYDGHDAWFGYEVPNAIPAGGDPSLTDNGDPATAANMAGHVIAVDIEIAPTSAWHSQAVWWSKQQFGPVGPSVAGTCEGGALTYGFGEAYLDGPAPAQLPQLSTLNAPPFGLGPTLLANVSGNWRIGTIATLPGPGNSARTFVHIPTCAWLDSGVPTAATALHSVTTDALPDGYTVFLVYNVTVTPGAVTWDWGDGAQTPSADAPQTPPATLPSYDATSQTWTDPCPVSHHYATVSAGRTITAAQTFTIAITVSWNDGITTHTQPVACDQATGGPCALTIGAAQGWQSGPHPVEQIEPVPFSPQLSG